MPCLWRRMGSMCGRDWREEREGIHFVNVLSYQKMIRIKNYQKRPHKYLLASYNIAI